MSIVICFNNKDPKPWQNALASKLKGVNIEIYPEVEEPEKVTFSLCWKPDKNALSKFSNLKVVQSVGASVEHIIQSQNLSPDCILTRIIDHQLSQDMFEYILAGIMSHLKKLPEYQLDEKQKPWDQKPYKRIDNTRIGILGLGKIGTHVAVKLEQLGFKVKAWSKSEKSVKNILCLHGHDGLSNVLYNTDILINILPLTAETENILNIRHLEQLNKNGYLINVGRGEHLVDSDLLILLNNNHLSGALLDVFRTEPLPIEHPFWQHDKIRITPHIAAITNVDTASDIVVTNYQNLLKGKELINIVSLKKGY
ncbi:glyoxylate/hydroxypyruvate reductase A [Aquimarina sp. D1M17]|uniref:2-hydroxyacid dehydrogenase n=1 Tax=Aquimarina acroporae TaxID=2937283 RepID=UPI0020BE7050|nr:glyoxylate/hydroxypyruvate reductase A [Aquimarina acroporae]MCK8523483.1 glyoxylate/hydroxypyruvate reductase A [Aquimarina acroporae]